MALPELTRKIVETALQALIERRVPAHLRDRIRVEREVRGNEVTLFESRPYFRDPSQWIRHDVARLRYSPANNLWALFCRDRDGKWHGYDPAAPTADVHKLVSEIERDPTRIFWG